MIIYYILSVIATIVLVITVPEHLIINRGSLYVLFLMGLMVYLSVHYKNNQADKDSDTTCENEEKKLHNLLSFSFKLFIPLCLPFIFFLIEWKKIVAAGIIFVVAFLTGPILFRLKYGKATKSRIENEKQESNQQINKEIDGEK